MSAPQPLPPLSNLFERDEMARRAYGRILPLENRQELLIRILGQMLIQAPSAAGRAYVAESINRCETDQQIIDLGELHLNHFIKYFKAKSKVSCVPSTHPSRPSFDAMRQSIFDSLIEAPKSHSEAKQQALVRDNYRCMLSGAVDSSSVQLLPQMVAEIRSNGETVKATHCCHILPQYITHGVDEDPRRETASNVWTIARSFGDIPDSLLNGPGIHDLRNIMTLESGIHTSFDALEIWLEPIEGTENKYKIGRREEYFCRELPELITFSSKFPNLALPDPRYLAFHAACARIIKLTGAAGFIERILRDVEQTNVLSEDGSSGELLDRLLSAESLVVF